MANLKVHTRVGTLDMFDRYIMRIQLACDACECSVRLDVFPIGEYRTITRAVVKAHRCGPLEVVELPAPAEHEAA